MFNIVEEKQPRRNIWVGYVARMKVSRSAKRKFYQKILKVIFHLGYLKLIWRNNIKGNEIVNLIKLIQYRFQLGAPFT